MSVTRPGEMFTCEVCGDPCRLVHRYPDGLTPPDRTTHSAVIEREARAASASVPPLDAIQRAFEQGFDAGFDLASAPEKIARAMPNFIDGHSVWKEPLAQRISEAVRNEGRAAAETPEQE